MRKRVGIIKRALSLLLIFLLSINSFAAIVSDNDGSAFVTKAEFDALKNSFAKQIDDYNSSIDGKIDGAIAQYLAGMTLAIEKTNLFDMFKNTSGLPNVVFANMLATGTSTETTEVEYNFTRHYTYKYINNLQTKWKTVYTGGQQYLQHFVHYSNNYDWFNPAYTNVYYQYHQAKASLAESWTDIVSTQLVRDASKPDDGKGRGNKTTAITNSSSTLSNKAISGVGSGWWLDRYNNSSYTLEFFCTKLFPKQMITANYHSYADRSSIDNALVDNGLGDTHTVADMTTTIAANSHWKTETAGDIGVDDDTTEKKLYTSLSQFMYREYNPGQDYGNLLLGRVTADFTIYGADDYISPTVASGTSGISLPDTYFYNIYYSATEDLLQKNKMTGGKVNYYKISITPKGLKPASQIVNSKMSSIAGEEVFLGSGCPIIDISADDTTVKFDFQVDTSSSTAKKIDYRISDKKFVCGDYQADATHLAEGTIDLDSDSSVKSVSFNLPKKGIVWINLVNQTSGEDAILRYVAIK